MVLGRLLGGSWVVRGCCCWFAVGSVGYRVVPGWLAGVGRGWFVAGSCRCWFLACQRWLGGWFFRFALCAKRFQHRLGFVPCISMIRCWSAAGSHFVCCCFAAGSVAREWFVAGSWLASGSLLVQVGRLAASSGLLCVSGSLLLCFTFCLTNSWCKSGSWLVHSCFVCDSRLVRGCLASGVA